MATKKPGARKRPNLRSAITSKRLASLGGTELPSLKGVPKNTSLGYNRRAGSSVAWVHVCTVGEYLSFVGTAVRQARGKKR